MHEIRVEYDAERKNIRVADESWGHIMQMMRQPTPEKVAAIVRGSVAKWKMIAELQAKGVAIRHMAHGCSLCLAYPSPECFVNMDMEEAADEEAYDIAKSLVGYDPDFVTIDEITEHFTPKRRCPIATDTGASGCCLDQWDNATRANGSLKNYLSDIRPDFENDEFQARKRKASEASLAFANYLTDLADRVEKGEVQI